MIDTVIQPAIYVIRQFDDTDTLVVEELLPESTTTEAAVIARAEELETLAPEFKTVWFLRGETTEVKDMPGTVIEKDSGDKRFFDIEGAVAETATIEMANVPPADLPLLFMATGTQPGDIIRFFDADGTQVAELVL